MRHIRGSELFDVDGEPTLMTNLFPNTIVPLLNHPKDMMVFLVLPLLPHSLSRSPPQFFKSLLKLLVLFLLQHRFFLATFQPAFSVQTVFKMKSFAYATVAFALATSVTARTFKVVNKCSYTIWPAVRPTLPLSLIQDADAFASRSCSLT